MITYQHIIDSLPPTSADYIQTVDEWIMLLNNAIRRSVMQTRRYRDVTTTTAPLPLMITSMPLINGIDGVPKSYTEHYTNDISGLSIWSNEVDETLNPVFARNGNQIIISSSQLGEHHALLRNHDLTLLHISDNIEYTLLKYIKHDSTNNTYVYQNVPLYTEELLPHRALQTRIVVPMHTNKRTSYYFTPAHTIDSLWDRPENPRTPPTITATINVTNVNEITVQTFYPGQNYRQDILDAIISGSITLNDTDGNGVQTTGLLDIIDSNVYIAPQAEQNSIVFNMVLLYANGVQITASVQLIWEHTVFPSFADDFKLTEKCLIDPVLLNLVKLELKKSFIDFTDDTTDLSRQGLYQIEIDREIERTRNAGQATLQLAVRNDPAHHINETQISTRSILGGF